MAIENPHDAALFALMLAEATKGQLESLAKSMITTNGSEAVITPYGYDCEEDPDGILGDLKDDGHWEPEMMDDEGLGMQLAKKAVRETDLLDRAFFASGVSLADILPYARGLACGALGIESGGNNAVDKGMLEFASNAIAEMKVDYNAENDCGFLDYRFSENPAPKAQAGARP